MPPQMMYRRDLSIIFFSFFFSLFFISFFFISSAPVYAEIKCFLIIIICEHIIECILSPHAYNCLTATNLNNICICISMILNCINIPFIYICHHNVDNHAFTQTQTLTEVEIRRTDGSLHTYHTLSGCGLLYYITAVCY